MTRKKRTVNKYPKAFRKMAMERLKSCESVTALSEELGNHRTLLYKWREHDNGEYHLVCGGGIYSVDVRLNRG